MENTQKCIHMNRGDNRRKGRAVKNALDSQKLIETAKRDDHKCLLFLFSKSRIIFLANISTANARCYEFRREDHLGKRMTEIGQ